MKIERKLSKTTMFIFIVMNFVLSMSSVVFNSILDKMAVSLNITLSQAGYLTSFYAFGAGIGVPIFLILFRKQSKPLLLKVTLGLNIIATGLIIIAPNYSVLLITRFLMGLMGNCYGVLAISTIAASSSKERVGKNLALLITGAASALMIGIPLTRLLINDYPWEYIFVILILLMIISLVYFIFNIKEDKEEIRHLNLKSEFEIFKQKRVSTVLLISVITFIGYGGFYTYITPYLINQFPRIEIYMSVLLILIGSCTVLGNLLGGIVCDKLGYYKSLLIATLLQVFITIGILMTSHLLLINIVLILLWMANGWFIGLQINTAITIVTENKSRLMISLNGSGVQLGQAIGTSLASQMILSLGLSTIAIISTVSSLIVVLIMLANRKENKK